MPISERYIASEELNELIDRSNEQGAGQPKDER